MARQRLNLSDNEDTLWERVARYAVKHGIEQTQARERLIRLGLFVSAVPFGSTLYRRANDPILDGWTTDRPPDLSDAHKYPPGFEQYNAPVDEDEVIDF
jgi:hypothetical protein